MFTDRELDIIKLEIEEKHRELLMQFAIDKSGNRYADTESTEVHQASGSGPYGGPRGDRPEVAI